MYVWMYVGMCVCSYESLCTRSSMLLLVAADGYTPTGG